MSTKASKTSKPMTPKAAKAAHTKAWKEFRAFTRGINPAKYAAMTPSQRKAYDKKADTLMEAVEASTEKVQDVEHRGFVDSVIAMVQASTRLEWEIVFNFLKRENKRIVNA